MTTPDYTHLQVNDRMLFAAAMRRESNIKAFLTKNRPASPSGELEVYENKMLPRGVAVLIQVGEAPKVITIG